MESDAPFSYVERIPGEVRRDNVDPMVNTKFQPVLLMLGVRNQKRMVKFPVNWQRDVASRDARATNGAAW